MKLIKFHLKDGKRLFINPEYVCCVTESATIYMINGDDYSVKESLFEVIEQLKRSSLRKPRKQHCDENSQLS